MDTLTHALMGAHAAHLGLPAAGRLSSRERLLLGAVAGSFPDVDFVGFLIDPLRYLAYWHQGPTHSLVLLPVWAILLGVGYCGVTRRWQAFGEAFVASSLGIASHIVLDVLTAYGTQVLYPLADWRVALGTTFVVDPLLTALIVASLAASLRSGGRHFAAIGLLLLAVYVGAQGVLRRQALEVASEATRDPNIERRQVDAVPQPFSPFNWKLVVTQGTDYRVAHINLAGHPALVPPIPGLATLRSAARAYVAPERLVWERRTLLGDKPEVRALAQPLWHRPDFAPFRHFAVHPALSRVDEDEALRCVWFTDLRYDLPALPDTFRYGHCQVPPGAPWRLFRLRYFTRDGLQALTQSKP
ncbi:MAG: metal-dependent hydrolase [Variovorax sp.]|nr:MAG: metal-dependent hydrolase [Variovorax sp.]